MNKDLLMMRRRQLAEVGRYAFPWLRDAGERLKDCGYYPLSLTDYYTEEDDVLIAGLVELLVPVSSNREMYINELHMLLKEHPWDMVQNRTFFFVLEQHSEKLIMNCPSLPMHKLLSLLDWVWDVFVRNVYDPEYVITTEEQGGEVDCLSIYSVLDRTETTISRLRYLISIMSLDDGFGRGFWQAVPKEDLHCPATPGLVRFLSVFYPLERIDNSNIDEILMYMGYDRPVEFIYAYWAYRWMKLRMKDELNESLAKFKSHCKVDKLLRWCSGTSYYRNKLKEEIPEIKL